VDEAEIGSWIELQERLFEDSWSEQLGRFRSQYAFHGLADASHSLETTLIRLGGDFARLERHLLRNFIKYAHRGVVERQTLWHWLSVAQHHGLPTRLLDCTYSPYAAMHSATSNLKKYDTAAAVWAVNYVKAHEMLPEGSRRALDETGSDVFDVQTLSRAVEDLQDLQRMSTSSFVGFFEPPSIDDRIVNQFALFSFTSEPETVLNEWLDDHPTLWRKIAIPADFKWEIRDKLDQANITERVLFPGLVGLSRWLK
jgi:hypothetical protein